MSRDIVSHGSGAGKGNRPGAKRAREWGSNYDTIDWNHTPFKYENINWSLGWERKGAKFTKRYK